jgi:hypothetical protein
MYLGFGIPKIVCLASPVTVKLRTLKMTIITGQFQFKNISPESDSVEAIDPDEFSNFNEIQDSAETLTQNSTEISTQNWCFDAEPYLLDHIPIRVGDFNGCCLCTQTYFYGCESCRDEIFPKLVSSFIIFMLMKQD